MQLFDSMRVNNSAGPAGTIASFMPPCLTESSEIECSGDSDIPNGRAERTGHNFVMKIG